MRSLYQVDRLSLFLKLLADSHCVELLKKSTHFQFLIRLSNRLQSINELIQPPGPLPSAGARVWHVGDTEAQVRGCAE